MRLTAVSCSPGLLRIAVHSGSGNAPLSSLPAGDRGSFCPLTTTAAGTAAGGSNARQCASSSVTVRCFQLPASACRAAAAGFGPSSTYAASRSPARCGNTSACPANNACRCVPSMLQAQKETVLRRFNCTHDRIQVPPALRGSPVAVGQALAAAATTTGWLHAAASTSARSTRVPGRSEASLLRECTQYCNLCLTHARLWTRAVVLHMQQLPCLHVVWV